MAGDPWGILSSLIPGGDDPAPTSPTPTTPLGVERDGARLYQTLPNVSKAYTKRYGFKDGSGGNPDFMAVVERFNPQVAKAVQGYDLDRVRKGQMPLTDKNAVRALVAADTKEAVTEAPDRSVLDVPGNAVEDLKTIVKSLPHIPGALVGEARDLMDGTNDNYKRMDEQGIDNPIARFLNLPGVRLVPGSYVASNVLEGNAEELLQHPLMAALDVLPYASKLAKGTKVVAAAEQAREASVLAGQYAPKVRPIPTVLTRTLDEAGNITPTRLGELVHSAGRSRWMAPLKDAFGKTAREVTRDVALHENFANTRMAVPAPDDVLGRIGHEVADISTDDAALMERYGITRQREAELGKVAGRGSLDEFDALPDNEKQFLTDMRDRSDRLAEYLLQQDNPQIGRYGNEVYPIKRARLLERLDLGLHNATVEFMGGEKVLRNGAYREVKGVYNDLTRLAAADDRWGVIKDLVDQGELAEASKRLNMMKRKAPEGPIAETYRRYITGAPADSGVTKANILNDQTVARVQSRLRALNSAQQTYDTVVARSTPARYDEIVKHISSEQMIEKLASKGVISSVDDARRWVQEGVLDQIPGYVKKDWDRNTSDVARTWQALKAEGIDPTFQHRVSVQRANDIGKIRFDGSVPSLQQAKSRINDWSPSVQSPSLTLSHQAMDVIRHEVGARLAEDVGQKWARPGQEIRDEFMPRAVEMAARDPRVSVASALDELVRREWRKYTPETIFPFAGHMSGVPLDDMWIPRDVASVLEQASKEGFTKLRTYSNPITRVWRVSLLPLSPRWHLYNILGGAVMTGAEVGPGAFRNAKQAFEIASAAKNGESLARFNLPDELTRTMGAIGHPEAELAFKRGIVARQLADSNLWQKGKGFVRKSYDLNSWWDDAYKAMSYLEGEKQAVARFKKAGVTDAEARILAQRDGIDAARRVLQDAASMTPFERSIMRQVVPFYGWLSHLVRFVTSYPADHPWRTAIMANAAQVVMEDMGSGANLSQLDSMFLGSPDENGEQASINIGSINPFKDVGNMFSLAGWLGNTNPLFQTAAEALGLDTSTGMADMYPNTKYDPTTGRMVQDTGNPLRNLVFNTLPQAQIASAFLGVDPEFQRRKHDDPEAAERQLWSAAGIPMGLVPKQKNELTQYVKNEVQRQKAKKEALSAALKSGDLNALDEWPELAELKPVLLVALRSGALDSNIQPPKEK